MKTHHPLSTDVVRRIQALSHQQRSTFTRAVQRVRAKHPASAEWDVVDWSAILDKIEGTRGTTAQREQAAAFEYWFLLHEGDQAAQEKIMAWTTARQKAGLDVTVEHARTALGLLT